MTKTPAYSVEVDHGGCEHCGAGQTWTVVGPDDYGIGQSFDLKDDAEEVADMLNTAHDQAISMHEAAAR